MKTPLKKKNQSREELEPNNTAGVAAKKAVAEAEAKGKIVKKQPREQPKLID